MRVCTRYLQFDIQKDIHGITIYNIHTQRERQWGLERMYVRLEECMNVYIQARTHDCANMILDTNECAYTLTLTWTRYRMCVCINAHTCTRGAVSGGEEAVLVTWQLGTGEKSYIPRRK